MLSILKSIFGTNNTTNNSIKVITPQTFKELVSNKDVQLIDVRTPQEYNSACIKNAKNIDIFSRNFITEVSKLNKQQPVYVYCRSGARSKKASKKLATLGFTEIYDLKGGILNYN